MYEYELHWNSIPMGAICGYEGWYNPSLGAGIYMLVVATTTGGYVGYYIGKGNEIGNRWRYHIDKWFVNPGEGYCIPNCPTSFLNDPVAVINGGDYGTGLPNRKTSMGRILCSTWFVFAEVRTLTKDIAWRISSMFFRKR